ncbi:class I SAM-dependent methyltransferase [Methanospirillum purgamenti]|uniref:Class I SAM-dependent methyltransferase n=1 Tax=Methanospirillum hungatei TaxID=2203 RepID=A0A8F5VIP9_METHU|nr:methyltransferase domain-containing protein [Methanospirillum hungatei]QXO93529.1 class I SAM-dependent methyltransferase [Methanospirillum hungatei]
MELDVVKIMVHDKKENYHYFEDINQGIVKHVGSNLKILDVGCGFGALGEELQKRNNIVYGIDISKYAVSVAKDRINGAFVSNATELENLPEEIVNEKFDLIIFADILEHIYDPADLLSKYIQFLKPSGTIIASIPNIATWNVRFSLLFGSFTYKDTGTLDKTHIRFFTRKTAKILIQKAGYEILLLDITPNFIRPFVPWIKSWFVRNGVPQVDPRMIIQSRQYQFYLKRIYPIEYKLAKIWKNFFSFQFIFIAKPHK